MALKEHEMRQILTALVKMPTFDYNSVKLVSLLDVLELVVEYGNPRWKMNFDKDGKLTAEIIP